mgnify:CR=1 FL=1
MVRVLISAKKNLHSGFRQNKKPSFRHSRTKNLHFTSDFGEMVPRDGARPHEKNVSLVFSASVFSQHRLVLVSAHGLRTLFLRVHRPVGCCLEWRRFDAHALETWDSRFASFQDCRRKNRWWWEERSIHIIYMCFHQCTYVCRHMCTSYIYMHACMHTYVTSLHVTHAHTRIHAYMIHTCTPLCIYNIHSIHIPTHTCIIHAHIHNTHLHVRIHLNIDVDTHT